MLPLSVFNFLRLLLLPEVWLSRMRWVFYKIEWCQCCFFLLRQLVHCQEFCSILEPTAERLLFFILNWFIDLWIYNVMKLNGGLAIDWIAGFESESTAVFEKLFVNPKRRWDRAALITYSFSLPTKCVE